MNKKNWKGISYISRKVDWEKFKSNTIIAVNALYLKKMNIYPTFYSNQT